MRVLVIGGAGYIGSHVSRQLLDKGHDVTVYDNLSSGLRKNIFAEEEFVQGDIMDYESLAATMKKGFDAVVHLAAFKAAGESMLMPEKYSRNNISGSINIMNAMCETGIKNICFSSSAAVYGEPRYNPIDEKHPQEPLNYYGFTKLAIEQILSWYDTLKGIKAAVLRYFNAAGYDVKGRVTGLEKNPQNLIPVIMETACGVRKKLEIFGDDYPTRDGSGVRDYIHVSDLADAHIAALEYIGTNKRSLLVNLGSEEGISVKEMLAAVKRITGKEVPFTIVERRPGDSAELYASSKKAHAELGWKAERSGVDTIVESTWNAYRKEILHE
ncbi:MAG: UDP-glucose 4-epimerase GalE [Spirochaetales bacterium]|nr:UDP-glucose 4-epimerase GalE [Spirochaetales bacterium]